MAQRSRVAVFRPASAQWFTSFHRQNWGANHQATVAQCGEHGDIPVPADYFGDGHIRQAVFRPSTGTWYIKGHGYTDWVATQGNISLQCGQAGDIPVPADYFGEGRVRIAVFRPSSGHWFIKGPGFTDWTATQGNITLQCGQNGDIPLPADYHGRGHAEIAVFRPASAHWFIKGPGFADWTATQGNITLQCGQNGDIPVPADYHGVGRAQIAVFRPSSGHWFIKGQGDADWTATQGNITLQCGQNGDIPVPGDYSKSGRAHVAVWRPSQGMWFIKGHGFTDWSNTQGNQEIQCGQAGDIPLPLNFRKGNKPKHARKMHTPQNWTWLK